MPVSLPFTPRLPPISHQWDLLDQHAFRPYYGLLWEQGLGKSKAIIDNAALLIHHKQINGQLVVAPNGVHRNWITSQLPQHWPEDAPAIATFAWDSDKAVNKSYQRDFADFLARTDPLRGSSTCPGGGVLAMSYDSLMTDSGKQASWDFLRARRALYTLDESQRAKDPSAKRTKRVLASSVYAPYRRIASGTPMDTPFDIYSQVRFLSADHWVRELACGSYASFKATFAEWVQRKTVGGREYPDLVAYRNLDLLHRSIADISSRVLKEDVLDLPPKTYKPLLHPLGPDQRRAYDMLKSEALALLETGELVTAEMALVLHLRLSQIGCGFVKPAPGEPDVPFRSNPRGDLLTEVLRDLTRPTLLWGRFKFDVSTMKACCDKAGLRWIEYSGQSEDVLQGEMRAGNAQAIIANLHSGMTEGYTLTEADSAHYYSRRPGLINRLQSEDRIHRIGQGRSVTYRDLMAEGTIDRKTVLDLVEKRGTSETVLGDRPREWLREALSHG